MSLPDKEFLKVSEVAKHYNVRIEDVYAACRYLQIKAIKIGRAVRIPKKELTEQFERALK